MENFSLFYSNEEDALLSYADIRNFQHSWNIVDDTQAGVIQVYKVSLMITETKFKEWKSLAGSIIIEIAMSRLLNSL